jgi:hypothetical protein
MGAFDNNIGQLNQAIQVMGIGRHLSALFANNSFQNFFDREMAKKNHIDIASAFKHMGSGFKIVVG